MLKNIVIAILVLNLLLSMYIINGYAHYNDVLNIANNTLMEVCSDKERGMGE